MQQMRRNPLEVWPQPPFERREGAIKARSHTAAAAIREESSQSRSRAKRSIKQAGRLLLSESTKEENNGSAHYSKRP
jgi:hypothetical protein